MLEEEELRRQILLFLNYLRRNPGSGFIILFMILLIICAFLVMWKNEKAAEILANWAYVLLVIGVIIKFVELKMNK